MGGGGSGRGFWLGGGGGGLHALKAMRWLITGSSCPPSNHTITLNLTLILAASWFGHASHVDKAEQDPPTFVHGCFLLNHCSPLTTPTLAVTLA